MHACEHLMLDCSNALQKAPDQNVNPPHVIKNIHVVSDVRVTSGSRARTFPFVQENASVAQQPVNKEKTNPSLSLRFQ